MNTPNPLIPQGSLLEQKAKGKPHLRVAYFIVAAHMLFLGFLLLSQGCKKEEQANANANQPQTNESALPPLNPTALYPTNTGTPATNPALADLPSGPSSAAGGVGQPPTQQANPIEQPTGPAREYVVIKGDSFFHIGRRFGVSSTAIARANPGVDSTRLKVGQKLVIPAPGAPTFTQATLGTGSENLYVVRSGDTLSKIAKGNATTVSEIKALNGLKTDRIHVGEKLKVPAAKAGPAAGTPTAI